MGGIAVGIKPYSIPGIGTVDETFENEIRFSPNYPIVQRMLRIDGTARDSGATPTTILRPGLMIGGPNSSGEYLQWSPTATDGTQFLAGILNQEVRMVDIDANNLDKLKSVIVAGGLKTARIIVPGAANPGSLTAMAKAVLTQAGFVLDDPSQVNFHGGWRAITAKPTDYTVVAADTGTLFTTGGAAGTVNFTLPTLAKGLHFGFFSEAAGAMTVTSAAGNDMVCFNDAAASSIAFSTAGEIIGNFVEVTANAAGTKWLVQVHLGAETVTPTIT